MDTESKLVKLLKNDSEIISCELLISDEFEDNPDLVILELIIDERKMNGKADNYFSALQDLRKVLEKESIQIMCNGAAKNVYPSPMQFDMGNTRKAYKLQLGKQARMDNMVDIFELEEGLEFVNTNEQLEFNKKWVRSLMG